MTDPFIGKWEMDAELNVYESGRPPVSGLYIIEATAQGYHIAMHWRTVDGDDRSAEYGAIPDGVDDRTLDSDAKAGGKVVSYARRVLSEDGQTMTITQSGTTAEGQSFNNVSIYRRKS